jgi:hypothetical protein
MWNGHIPLRSFDAHFPDLEGAGELTISPSHRQLGYTDKWMVSGAVFASRLSLPTSRLSQDLSRSAPEVSSSFGEFRPYTGGVRTTILARE